MEARPVQAPHPHRLAEPLPGEDAVDAVVADQLPAAEPVDRQAIRLKAVPHAEVANSQHQHKDGQRPAHKADEQPEKHREADRLANGEQDPLATAAKRQARAAPRPEQTRPASLSDATSCPALVQQSDPCDRSATTRGPTHARRFGRRLSRPHLRVVKSSAPGPTPLGRPVLTRIVIACVSP